jgi:outer membrane protein TolC
MRLLSPLAFLAAASLLGADLGQSVHPGQGLAVPSDRALLLNEAIDRALVNNLGLSVNRLDALKSGDGIDLAEAGFDTVFAWRNATGGALSSAERAAGDPVTRAYDSDVTLTRKFTWGGTLSVGAGMARGWTDGATARSASNFDFNSSVTYTQPLLRNGWQAVNLTSLISARQLAVRSRLALRAAALDLIRDTEVAYWNLAGARALVALRETSFRSAETLLAQIKAKRQLGDATVLEELQAEADVSTQKVAVLNARQLVDSSEMSLRRVLGRGAADNVEQALVVQPLSAEQISGPPEFRPWIKTVSEFDFESAIQLSNVNQADAVLAQAQQNDKPALDLVIGGTNSYYGLPGSPGSAVSFDGFQRRPGWSNSAALTLSFPLGFREAEATLRSASRSRRQAELRLADVRQNLVFNARATWRDLEAARARVAAATSALNLQRQSYEGERARYEAGQSNVLLVLQAQAALDAAQVNWVQSQLDARSASARVARLDGSILPRHGFTMDVVEAKVGSAAGLNDTLPPLPDIP